MNEFAPCRNSLFPKVRRDSSDRSFASLSRRSFSKEKSNFLPRALIGRHIYSHEQVLLPQEIGRLPQEAVSANELVLNLQKVLFTYTKNLLASGL